MRSIQTLSAFAFSSKSDSAFDDLTASLGDGRPHPAEEALFQLGRALMTELFGVSAFGTDLGLRIMEGLGLVAVT
ncbi:hypothetical protein [Brevundimonas vesicularis]|uniref:hypothetical protein n=1 Tax=Brevundimonas vesicularis TaxID=41276 RepID=UPI00384D1F83